MTELLAHLFDPVTLAVMLAAAFTIATLQNGMAALKGGTAALRPLLTADPDRDRQSARAAMRQVDHLAQLRGLACTDRVKANNPFLAHAIAKLSASERVEQFEIWAEEALADRAQRHASACNLWNAIADTAPALGMAGTVIGLVGMFATMDDPAHIGPSMALALLTTLYGLLIANVIAAPIAARLADLSQRELAWQRELVDRMLAVARRENAPVRRASIREVA
ncbi:MotA/TolQ/ExbB proton channel family protein [Sphingobium sp. H39-3-25]|uniref:motility protein A n=1 Tax=Sphingobium arseniciresistens TaxID=3030834 RepID=UPI0023BA29E6|nr:MotA/TolQ/ExbB proton channel family protein [Sphingobium arseniciresistens]